MEATLVVNARALIVTGHGMTRADQLVTRVTLNPEKCIPYFEYYILVMLSICNI